MKTLTASKAVALAACGSSSASASGTPFLCSKGLGFQAESLRTLITRLPRGGDSDGNSKDKDKDKENPDQAKPPKQHPRQKKRRQRHRDGSESSASASKEDPAVEQKSNSNSSQKPKFVEEILSHEDFYLVLGVSKTATEIQIKKAYRKRAVQTHPDKTGGDRRAFDKVAEAYDALSDETKRQVYDRFGKEGLENGGAGATSSSSSSYQDLFRSMFQQQQQAQARRRQNQTVRYQLQVTLEDLYNGMTQSVLVSPPNQNGRLKQKQKKVQVHVPKGSVSGQSILLSGEMDFATHDTPGDLIFVLTQLPHPTFTCKGLDLAMEMTVSLEEAVCGLQRSIRHLDGTNIWIQSARHADGDGDAPVLIQTGDVQVLKGRGMPKKNHNGDFGDLYVQYRVEMPKSTQKAGNPLSKEELKELARLLAKLQGNAASKKKPDDDIEVFSLLQASSSDFGRASGSVQFDEDEHLHVHDDHGEEFHPFASNFFQGASRGSGFYFGGNGGHPFGGPEQYGDDDGSNVQCQQM